MKDLLRDANVKITFSIVITTYNSLNRLEGAIESALAQTIPCETILVDDGSNDGTEAYGRHLGKWVSYYRHRVRLGYGESLNVGVELARGNWIKFLNDSDRLEPTCLEQIKQAIERFPSSALVSNQALELRPDEVERPQPDGNSDVVCIPQKEIRPWMLAIDDPARVTVRRDAFLRAGGWTSPTSSSNAAIDCWRRVAQYGDALSIDRSLSDDRLVPTHSLDRHLDDRFAQNDRTMSSGLTRSITRTWSGLAQILSPTRQKSRVGDRKPHQKGSNSRSSIAPLK